MEKNNGIKIKTSVIYSLVMLVMIGLLAYYEVLAIKKRFSSIIKMGNRAEIWGLILAFFLLHLIYLFLALYLICLGRKIELTKKGCIINVIKLI